MSTLVCEYDSLIIPGERLRVERLPGGRYQLCRLDRRGRRIRAMTMPISRTTAVAHRLVAFGRGGIVNELDETTVTVAL